MALTKHPAVVWPHVYAALVDAQQQLLQGTPRDEAPEAGSGPMQPLAAMWAAVNECVDRGATDAGTRLKTLLSVCCECLHARPSGCCVYGQCVFCADALH